MVPEACSTWFLPRARRHGQAAEWVYSGRVFPAEEALAGGLVSRVVEPDALLPAARELAREIAENTSAVSVALARQIMWTLLGADHPMEAHRLDSRGMEYMGRSPDAREGVTSFLEKRPPRFTMRPSADMPPVLPLRRRAPVHALSGTTLLCLMILGNTFLVGAFSPLLPEIARTRGLADWQLGVVAGAFGFARMAGRIPAGRLAGRHLALSLVLAPAFLAVGLVCLTVGGTFALLVLGRALMGFGHTLLMVGGLTAILQDDPGPAPPCA